MAGPTKQFDQDETLNRALDLFWTQGYEATSMQELVEAMGINRASMYQTYGNKHQLFLASIERYMQRTIDSLQQLQQAHGSPVAKLHGLFRDIVNQSLGNQMQGCLINNTAVELGPHDQNLAEKIRQVWEQFEDVFTAMINDAIQQGEIKAGSDARVLAQLLNTNIQGLLVKSKAGISKQELDASIDTLFNFLRK
jgi:TetR/AcrR family transcriptional repressor of nem operon